MTRDGPIAAEVLVMAGGCGTRLGELTSTTPKPMLPLDGKPILQHLLEHLRDQGVRHVYLSVRHLSNAVMDHFGDGASLGIGVDYVLEGRPLGTAGAIGLLPTVLEPLLVVNGDIVADIPCAVLLRAHVDRSAAMTVCHVEHPVSVPFGVLTCSGEGDVVRVDEKPCLDVAVAAGVYVIAPDVAGSVPADEPLDMPGLMSSLLRQHRRVIGFGLPGPWVDIGTPETYREAMDLVRRSPITAAARPAGNRPARDVDAPAVLRQLG